MSALPEDLKQALAKASLIKGVDVVPRGHTRIETNFRYPDGTSIEVFLPSTEDSLQTGPLTLTDFGQTTSWLMNLQVKPWLSKKRQVFLEEALSNYDVVLEGGALVAQCKTVAELPSAIIRLGQACLRASDLVFTRRASLQSTFIEQFEEILSDVALFYEPAVDLPTRFRNVRVDFLVHGSHSKSAVLTLASATSSAAHGAANEVFARFYDLKIDERPEQRVTVFDDSVDVYRDADLERLRTVSDVLPFSDRNSVHELLAA